MHQIIETLGKWAQVCQDGLRDCAMLFQPFYKNSSPGDAKLDFMLSNIHTACTLTSDSALLLISKNKLWDAEILVRSVMEGTMKFVFLCTPDESERSRRLIEYWDTLPEIARLKTSTRIERLLSLVDNPDAPEWRPLRDLLLSQEETTTLKEAFSQKQKQDLEKKWSFIGIAEHFAQSRTPGHEAFSTLLHGYGMSSHLLHQDGSGIGMIWERNQRSQERIATITLAHAGRECSDLLHTSILRATAAYRLRQVDLKPISDLLRKYESFSMEVDEAAAAWHRVEYEQHK